MVQIEAVQSVLIIQYQFDVSTSIRYILLCGLRGVPVLESSPYTNTNIFQKGLIDQFKYSNGALDGGGVPMSHVDYKKS